VARWHFSRPCQVARCLYCKNGSAFSPYFGCQVGSAIGVLGRCPEASQRRGTGANSLAKPCQCRILAPGHSRHAKHSLKSTRCALARVSVRAQSRGSPTGVSVRMIFRGSADASSNWVHACRSCCLLRGIESPCRGRVRDPRNDGDRNLVGSRVAPAPESAPGASRRRRTTREYYRSPRSLSGSAEDKFTTRATTVIGIWLGVGSSRLRRLHDAGDHPLIESGGAYKVGTDALCGSSAW